MIVFLHRLAQYQSVQGITTGQENGRFFNGKEACMNEYEYQYRPFPDWISETKQPPVTELTMFTNRALVHRSITSLIGAIGLPYDASNSKDSAYQILFSAKAAPVGFLDAVDPKLPVSISIGRLKEVLTRYPDRKIEMYFGRPNKEDVELFQRYGVTLIDIATAQELELIRQTFTSKRIGNIETLLFDGTVSDGFDGGVKEYIQMVSALFPDRFIDLKILTNVSPSGFSNFRHGQARGVDYAVYQLIARSSVRPELYGVNLYTHNPLDVRQIETFWKLLGLDKSDIKHADIPKRIVIGGFGGRGDTVPFGAIRNFVMRVHKVSPDTTVILNIGTYLVEHSSVLVAPHTWSREKVNQSIPDLNDNPQGLFGYFLTNVGYIIYRPVAYPPNIPVVIQ